jgi:hypothetical protein
MRVILVMIGIILLLPGLCSLGFMVAFIPQLKGNMQDLSGLVPIWLLGFAISFGGIQLIRGALRSTRPPRK